jgi:hypothetical protein
MSIICGFQYKIENMCLQVVGIAEQHFDSIIKKAIGEIMRTSILLRTLLISKIAQSLTGC